MRSVLPRLVNGTDMAETTKNPELRVLAASQLSFEEIATQYDEETAIQVGILRDPDVPRELTAADFERFQLVRKER